MEVNPQKLSVDSAVTVDEALLTRRSVRAFLNKAVTREQIEDVLRLASYAPSGSNFQPWRICRDRRDARQADACDADGVFIE